VVGLDKAGNEVEHSFVDPEMFYKPVTRYEFKKKDPKNEYSPLERVCVEAGINPYDYRYTEYTLPFNEKNFENLYNQRPTKDSSSVSMVYWQKVQVRGLDKLPTWNNSLRYHLMICGRKQSLPNTS
jgi:hypothetical protein